MGIQPIDLQTMYSQLSNVSKSINAAQQVQLTDAMQQQNNIQKTLENSKKVQQTSNEQAKANNINQNGSNSSSYFGNQKKQNKQTEENESKSEYLPKSNSPYIGTIIDITR